MSGIFAGAREGLQISPLRINTRRSQIRGNLIRKSRSLGEGIDFAPLSFGFGSVHRAAGGGAGQRIRLHCVSFGSQTHRFGGLNGADHAFIVARHCHGGMNILQANENDARAEFSFVGNALDVGAQNQGC